MNLRFRRPFPAVAAMTVFGLACFTAPGAMAQQKPKMAEEVFKNIQALKGISVDDFLGTMGIMSAAVGFDCSECHTNAGTDKVDWAADTAKKIIARKMVNMVTAINKENFGGRQMVSCWTCHRGRDHPMVTPTMDIVYGTPHLDPDDVLMPGEGQPSVDQILDKYIKALGGADKLASIKSYAGVGKSIGFGGFGGGGQVHLWGKAPDKRTTLIEFKDAPGRGDSIRAYNGQNGWIKTPLAVLTEYQLTGNELDGARVDAELAFPTEIKKALTNLRVALPATISDLPGPSAQTTSETSVGIGQDRVVNVLQGTSPKGTLVTMFFDQDSGLLLRTIRYTKTPIGRVPTQVEYADYRDVGGVKFPFRLTLAWLDGRDSIQLDELKTNVPVDDAKFGEPASWKPN
jgi:photosynthetic reaction center cytochrome c subunit